jgi:phosphonoacetaldehyde hydrolase
MASRRAAHGSTTGYTRELLHVAIPVAARHGYAPDASVTPDEVAGDGRKPFMCYRNAILLGAYPLWRCVKIGDTASDIAEGINAGMWTVGITATGNEIGLSRGDWEALPRDSRATLEREAARRLTELADLCRDGLFLNAQRWLALTVGAEEGQEDRRDTKRSILHIH